mgnify:CR=1 FL=1
MLKTVQACASREKIATILDEDGCVIIQGLAENSVVDRVVADLDIVFNQANFAQGIFVGYRTKRLGSILKKSGVSCHLLTSGRVLDAMGHLLLENCERFQLNLTQAVSIHPNERAQILHRDDELFPCRAFTGEMMGNAIWALTDFTAENGGTQVVLGSHKWPRDRQPEPQEIVQAEMKKGSVLIYRGSLLHGGGANRSTEPRAGLIFSYNLGWLRQGENQYLAYPPAVAKYLPDAVQQLIGYTVHRPNLGQHECSDPQQLLSPRGTKRGFNAYDFLTAEQEVLAKAHVA